MHAQALATKRLELEEKKRKTGVSFVTRIDVDKEGTVEVQPSGTDERKTVSKSSLRQCRGAGVLVPGPSDVLIRGGEEEMYLSL